MIDNEIIKVTPVALAYAFAYAFAYDEENADYCCNEQARNH
jgi:hypothetical protein